MHHLSIKMYIGKNFFNIKYIIPDNKKTIKEGDILPYSIIRRIDNEKALVRIMGKKLLANMGKNISDEGFAKVVSINDQVMLSVIKGDKDNYIDSVIIKGNVGLSKEIFNMLIDAGLKGNSKNILYLETILKHLPHLNNIEHRFIFTAMSKEVYFTVDEFRKIFNALIFKSIFENIKSDNKSHFNSDDISMLSVPVLNGNIDAKDLSEYLLKNGNMSLWLMLFEKLHKDLDTNSNILFCKLLALNKKSKFFKENVYLFPIPFMMEGKLLEVNMFVDGLDGDESKKTFIFRVCDDELLFFDIKIYNLDEFGFNISICFYTEKLYNDYSSIRDDVRIAIYAIEKKYGISIELEYSYGKKE